MISPIRIGAGIFLVLLCGCRTQSAATVQAVRSPTATAVPAIAFAVPVGMLPVNVVGSYGGGTDFARRVGAGKHPIPSGIGVPLSGSSAKQSEWACMVLVYGNGAAVQYEGLGRCGIDKRPSGVKSAVCEVPLPKKDPAQPKGVIEIGWCTPTKQPNLSRK